MTAVLSYNAWKTIYAGDESIVGSTVRVNTQPVTVIGIAPQAFFGDRIVSTPPDFYLPIESMPAIANAPYVHGSDMLWLYMIGRLKPGVKQAQLQEKVNAVLRQSMEDSQFFKSKEDKVEAGPCARDSDARRRRNPGDAGGVQGAPAIADVGFRAGAADCVREHCQPAAGAWHDAANGDERTDGAGRNAEPHRAPAANRERAAGCSGRSGRTGGGVRGHADAACAGVSRCDGAADRGEPVAAGAGVCCRVYRC